MNYDQIVDEVAKELNLPYELVDRTYKSYWKFIRDFISSLPLKEVQSRDDFLKLKTNINIPSLGKLSCSYDRFVGLKKRFELIKKIRENNYVKDK